MKCILYQGKILPKEEYIPDPKIIDEIKNIKIEEIKIK